MSTPSRDVLTDQALIAYPASRRDLAFVQRDQSPTSSDDHSITVIHHGICGSSPTRAFLCTSLKVARLLQAAVPISATFTTPFFIRPDPDEDDVIGSSITSHAFHGARTSDNASARSRPAWPGRTRAAVGPPPGRDAIQPPGTSASRRRARRRRGRACRRPPRCSSGRRRRLRGYARLRPPAGPPMDLYRSSAGQTSPPAPARRGACDLWKMRGKRAPMG